MDKGHLIKICKIVVIWSCLFGSQSTFAVTIPSVNGTADYSLESEDGDVEELKQHIAMLNQIVSCQQEIIQQAKQGVLPDHQTYSCPESEGAILTVGTNHSISTFNTVLDQVLGISSSALTAAPPVGSIVVNMYLLSKGKADRVYKKDFLWPILDMVANADNIAYFLHGRYAMGRKEGSEDIASQSVAIGFDVITVIMLACIKGWQSRAGYGQSGYIRIQ